MTAAIGFKRLGYALAALVAGGAILLALANYLVSAESVRRQVMSELRAVTGLEPVLRGPIKVSLLPSGRVRFADVVLGDPAKPALTAERLTARLRFLPLLIGRVEISEVSLDQPTIAVDVDPKGGSNWSALIDALARGQQSGVRQPAAFSEIRINGGTVVVRDPAHRVNETLSDVQVSLAWPSISKSFGATGHFIWRGEPIEANLTLADFPAALSGNRTGVKLRLAGAPLKGAFEGAISLVPTVKVEGTLAADCASLRDTMAWLGKKPLPGGGFGHFAIKAKTDVAGSNVGLSSVNVELDGNTAEGALSLTIGTGKSLQGTLAADKLDLSPYVSTIKLLTANQREWSNGPIALEGLGGLDVDLRLSANSVIAADAAIGHTAIGINLRGGDLVLTVGEAQAYNGLIKGAMTFAHIESGIDVKSQFQFVNVDLEPSLGQLFGMHRIEGKGNMSVTTEGSGDSVLAVTRNLTGVATLTGEKGALTGFNVEQLLRRLERRPLSGSGEFRSGRTLFDTINIALKIEHGTARVEDITLVGPAVKIAMTGTASIPTRVLNLTGTASLVTPSKPGGKPFELPFVVEGSWDNPSMLPDAEALIRRSGAAAPLLDAVRDRSARDKVRSVLEKLTGAPAAPSAAAPPPAAVPAADQATAPASADKQQ